MNNFITILSIWALAMTCVAENKVQLDAASTETLQLPTFDASDRVPGVDKMVRVTPPEYEGTDVFHTLYLPDNWKKNGERLPIIFEYTGNYYPPTGSSGKMEDAALGYGLSGGKYIWVSLPYISEDHTENQVKWWGDLEATVEYAKVNVPRIIETYGADPDAVFLCGFSRGSIAVNYIGLYDDEIAKLWSAFITHDHFDGAREWGGWGSPMAVYQEAASNRLMRVTGRPYMVGSNGGSKSIQAFLDKAFDNNIPSNFYVHAVGVGSIFPEGFPNDIATHGHTDRWPLRPSKYRAEAWEWMNGVIDQQN